MLRTSVAEEKHKVLNMLSSLPRSSKLSMQKMACFFRAKSELEKRSLISLLGLAKKKYHPSRES